MVGEFRRILDQQDRPRAIIVTEALGGEVAAENVGFIHASIGEEAIGRLRARPVLASKRDAAAHAVTNLLQQLGKPSAKAGILEGAFIDLTIGPMLGRARVAIIATQAR